MAKMAMYAAASTTVMRVGDVIGVNIGWRMRRRVVGNFFASCTVQAPASKERPAHRRPYLILVSRQSFLLISSAALFAPSFTAAFALPMLT